MALPDLTNQFIQDTYQRVLQLANDGTVRDGTGSLFIGTYSGSFSGDGSGLTGITADINTGSFATTGSNTFIGDQIISGSLNVTSSFTASGLIYPTIDGTDGQVIVTDGAGNLSFGHGEKLHLQVRNDDSVTIPAGTPIYSTGEIGGSERIKVRIASASDASKMPAIGIVETTLTTIGATQDGFAIINGIYNTNITPVSGTPALGDNIYVHADGGVTTIKPSGSNLIQNIGTVLKTNGTIIQGMKVSSIDRTNDVPNLLDNTIFFGSGSDQTQQIHISGALDQTIINNITASGNISASGDLEAINVTSNGAVTASVYANKFGSFTLGTPDDFIFIEPGGDSTIDFRSGETNFKYNDLFFRDAQNGVTIILQGSNGADNVIMEFGDPEFESTGRKLTLDIDKASAHFNGLNITASNNITANGQIIGDIVDTSFETFLNFEAALTSYTYIAPFPLTINFTGSSTSSMEVVEFVTASANTDTFSTQQTPPITLNAFDKLKITPSSSGLFTFSGSRII